VKRLCDCGCRRPAKVEWMHPSLGSFWFGALCDIRNRDALEAQGFSDFPELTASDDQPKVTVIGTSADFEP
jgi:hypothetical protein